MGSGIAQLCAAAGFKTILYDINEAAVHKGLSVITHNLVIAVEKNKITEQEKRNTAHTPCVGDLHGLAADFDGVQVQKYITHHDQRLVERGIGIAVAKD